MKYNFKLLDICNFIEGSMLKLSENLLDKDKIITKRHFSDNFELLKEKACFPYKWLTKENRVKHLILSFHGNFSTTQYIT